MGAMACLLLCISIGCAPPGPVLPDTCGDGLVNRDDGEECDTEGSSPSCDEDCTFVHCGDGTVNASAGERCDDGNVVSGDGCNADCQLEICGNGTREPGEACDDAGMSPTCDDDCTPAECGDGTVNDSAGELCDDGNVVPGDGCNADCRTSGICGDGTHDTDEECDESGVDTESCDHDCTAVVCGDGLVNAAAGEACDESGVDTESCDHDCTAVECGDGLVNAIAGEECDDGNQVDGDGCSSECLLAPGTTLWSHRFGGASGDNVTGVAVDSDGNVLLTGSFQGTADFGGDPLSSAGSHDVFVVKLDPQGQHLWSRRLGWMNPEYSNGIAVDSAGNVLLTGRFVGTTDFGGDPLASAGYNDIFAVKLDPQGQHLWSRGLGGTSEDYGHDIAVDSDDNVLLTGYFHGTVNFGGGPLSSAGYNDIFAVKLDPQGQHLWSRRFGGPSGDDGKGIAVDSADNVLLTGEFIGAADFGGGPLASAGGWDIFAVQLDPQGQHLWSRRFGGTGNESGDDIAVDSARNVLLTGSFQGTVNFGGAPLPNAGLLDVFAVQLDPQGQHLWSRRFGGTSNDHGLGVAVDSDGNVLLTGDFFGTADFGIPLASAGGQDVFAVKLDHLGQHLWSRRLGGTSNDAGLDIAVDSAGKVLLTGNFLGTVDFGGGPVTSAGAEDIFAAKLSP